MAELAYRALYGVPVCLCNALLLNVPIQAGGVDMILPCTYLYYALITNGCNLKKQSQRD